MWLRGVRALIVGGASGLGRAIAQRFLEEGARVAVFDRDEPKLAHIRHALGEECLTILGDVTDVSDQRRGLAEVSDVLGGLDAMIFTVGVVDWMGGFNRYEPEAFTSAFDEVMAVNVRGPLSMTIAARTVLETSENASITFTLSTSATEVPASGPVYGVAKSGLMLAVKQLALDLAPRIRVNAVIPGAVLDSDIRGPSALDQSATRSARLSANDAAARLAETNLVGFAASGADYAGLYVLLVSNEGRVATGGVIPWDTGLQVTGHERQ